RKTRPDSSSYLSSSLTSRSAGTTAAILITPQKSCFWGAYGTGASAARAISDRVQIARRRAFYAAGPCPAIYEGLMSRKVGSSAPQINALMTALFGQVLQRDIDRNAQPVPTVVLAARGGEQDGLAVEDGNGRAEREPDAAG